MAKTSTLRETFRAPLDPAKWDVYSPNGELVVDQAAGRLTIRGTGFYAQAQTVTPMDFTGSTFAARLTGITGTDGVEWGLRLNFSGGTIALFQYGSGDGGLAYRVDYYDGRDDTSEYDGVPVYAQNDAAPLWVRFRHDLQPGTGKDLVVFEISPDAATWDVRRVWVSDIDLTQVRPAFFAGDYSGGDATVVRFDGVNGDQPEVHVTAGTATAKAAATRTGRKTIARTGAGTVKASASRTGRKTIARTGTATAKATATWSTTSSRPAAGTATAKALASSTTSRATETHTTTGTAAALVAGSSVAGSSRTSAATAAARTSSTTSTTSSRAGTGTGAARAAGTASSGPRKATARAAVAQVLPGATTASRRPAAGTATARSSATSTTSHVDDPLEIRTTAGTAAATATSTTSTTSRRTSSRPATVQVQTAVLTTTRRGSFVYLAHAGASARTVTGATRKTAGSGVARAFASRAESRRDLEVEFGRPAAGWNVADLVAGVHAGVAFTAWATQAPTL